MIIFKKHQRRRSHFVHVKDTLTFPPSEGLRFMMREQELEEPGLLLVVIGSSTGRGLDLSNELADGLTNGLLQVAGMTDACMKPCCM